jgi:hypothetical protein
MVAQHTVDVARRAQQIYEQVLKSRLEATNRDDFVAIEPESGEYFIAKTLTEAIQAARSAHPQHLSFALRVGHDVTVELGMVVS